MLTVPTDSIDVLSCFFAERMEFGHLLCSECLLKLTKLSHSYSQIIQALVTDTVTSYKGVSKSVQTESITKYALTTINTH